MLNKSFNLEKKIANWKFDFVKNFKYFVIAPLAIILVGIILVLTIGFNKGIDFTGGTTATIYIGDEIEFSEAQTKIESVLQENEITASVFQQVEIENNNYITVKFQNKDGLTNAEIETLNIQLKSSFYDEFGYDQLNTEQTNYVEMSQIDGSIGDEYLLNAFISIVVASILLTVYLVIRYGLTSAMSSLLCVYHDLLITTGLVAIFRLEINLTFIAALVSILAYSLINTIVFFERVKRNSNEFLVKNKEIANLSARQNMYTSTVISWYVILILAILASIGTANILPFALPMIIGVFANYYSTNFLAPSLWSFAFIRRVKKVKEKLPDEV